MACIAERTVAWPVVDAAATRAASSTTLQIVAFVADSTAR